jgi:hypothetical protein
LTTEFLSELENKIDSLIVKVQTLKQEKAALMSDGEVKSGRIAELEAENAMLQEDVASAKSKNEENEKKFGNAVEKVQGLLSKLSSIE